MKVVFASAAWRDYLDWHAEDPKQLGRLKALIEECRRTPFSGVGKPEPLKGELKGFWSRRINQEDRLVYRVTGSGRDQQLEIAQCRHHY